MLAFHLCLGLTSDVLPSGLCTKTLYINYQLDALIIIYS